MKKRLDTRSCWLLTNRLLILLLFIVVNNFDFVMAAPMSSLFPIQTYEDNIKKSLLHKQVEDQSKLAMAQSEIQMLSETRVQDQYIELPQSIQPELPSGNLNEMLPVPSAYARRAKAREEERKEYWKLCHFKICNFKPTRVS